jgi:hypothetical protein
MVTPLAIHVDHARKKLLQPLRGEPLSGLFLEVQWKLGHWGRPPMADLR